MKYYINGWRESEKHFYEVGRFTEEEKEALNNGEVVIKNGNEFYIEF